MNTNKSKLLRIIGAGAIGIGSMFANYSEESPYLSIGMPTAYAATRYGIEKKDAKYINPASIKYSDVMVESKYYKEFISLKENDTRKENVLAKLANSVDEALTETAGNGGYDIVVDKGDKGSESYGDITASVIKKLKEKEK